MKNIEPDGVYPCPVCQSDGHMAVDLPSGFLRREYSKYYSSAVDAALQICDYKLIRCSGCTLEFAFPYTSASPEFYDWLSLQEGYYPRSRWEWGVCIDLLGVGTASPLRLLEVGCGDGGFLKMVQGKYPSFVGKGLDASPVAVACCKTKGVDADVGDVRDYLIANPYLERSFDFAASFHCLEHVEDPLGFARSLCQAVRPGGSVFLSTPFSPMSIEVAWFDVLNHPPHHLTRWNVRSYQELATQCGAELVLHSPQASSAWSRALLSLAAEKWGRKHMFSAHWQRKSMLRHPLCFFRHLQAQRLRERIGGEFSADVVLAEFRLAR